MIHKCVNPKCSYYRNNLKQVPKGMPKEDRHKYKLHYIYREFSIDFFKMDMTSLPKNASSLQFRKHNAHIMGLCLTYSVNLGLSLRKTAVALKEIHGIDISHTTVENYCRTAAALVRPFLMTYPFKKSTAIPAAMNSLILLMTPFPFGLLITTSSARILSLANSIPLILSRCSTTPI